MQSPLYRRSQLLTSVGVVGLASYQLFVRSTHSGLLRTDLVHGIWLGTFLGLEFMGIYLFIKARRHTSA